MKLMVFPREDGNPYQRLLYEQMQRLGTRVSYLGCLTPSHTVNLLLLPLETAVRRAAGARLVHLHWVFAFSFPGAERLPVLRRLAQTWFGLWLRTARLLGVHMVWTAHNVVPHAPVFADDIAARRTLVAASDLVIVHSEPALTGLAALGAVPRRSVVIPHGPLAPVLPAALLPAPDSMTGPRRILFFGKILEYKGTEDLLTAFAALPAATAVCLTVAGQCDDPAMTARLRTLARAGGARVTLRLERIPEPDVGPLLASADAVALPYRRATTSGCAMLALSYGRPLILPDLDAFAHLPRAAVVSYDGTRQALTSALARVASAEGSALAAMATAARAYAATLSWHDIAVRTRSEMNSAASLGGALTDRDEALANPDAVRKPAW